MCSKLKIYEENPAASNIDQMLVEYNFAIRHKKLFIFREGESKSFAALDVRYACMRRVNITDVAPLGKKRKFYGFELRFCEQSHYFFADSKMRQNRWLRQLRSTCILQDVCRQFSIGSMIGRGGFGTVHVCQRMSTRSNYAIKIIDKRLVDSDKRIL